MRTPPPGMNLQPITNAWEYPFTFTCYGCGQRVESNHDDGARADLNGPAWLAYYCGACVATLEGEGAN